MLSVKITNALCNLQCTYCYEHIYRTRMHPKSTNMDAIKTQIRNEQLPPYLHGGEPLLAPMELIEEILSMCFEQVGHSSLQTNGTLINNGHIEMFKKYNTSVGISIDGPGELGAHRKTLRGNKPTADLVMENMRRLRNEGISVGTISVLTRANALPERRHEFKAWVRELDKMGISGRMNPAQIDYPSVQHIALTDDELAEFYSDMTRFILTEVGGDWLPYRDIVDSLLGLNQGTCCFGECDYYNAIAEKAIFSDGSTGSCLKTAKTGHVYPRFQNADADSRGFAKIRYEILPSIEREYGGCKGCIYWRNCTGGCPSEGLGGDWRNRTRYCKAHYSLFETTSEILRKVFPNIILTCDLSEGCFPNKNSVRDMSPNAFVFMTGGLGRNPSSWRKDAQVDLEQLISSQDDDNDTRQCWVSTDERWGHGDRPHGDSGHGDSGHGDGGHGDRPHGDRPHGDSSHGDMDGGDGGVRDDGHGDRPHGDGGHGDRPHGDSFIL